LYWPYPDNSATYRSPGFGIRLALVASTLAMSDFANDVIGGLAFSAALGGLIIGGSLILLALVPPERN